MCGVNKKLEDYPNRKDSFDGRRNDCKVCNKIKDKEKQIKSKVQRARRGKEYRLENLEYILNREAVYIQTDEYRENRRKYERDRRTNDPLFKLSKNIRGRLRTDMNKEYFNKKYRTAKVLGCNYVQFLAHLNNNPYSFEYGVTPSLDLDHIIPVSSASNEEDILKLNHYTNFQLLPSTYNQHVKSNNPWDKEHFEEWLKTNKI